VHHGLTHFDLLGTGRHPLWASLLLVYLWVDGAMLWLMADPGPFAWGMVLTQALDLWRHSDLDHPGLELLVGWLLITPRQHAHHHSPGGGATNFGANLNLWDRLLGSFHRPGAFPGRLGPPLAMGTLRQLGWPFP
jgi:sterol desaturase/sphingolipid hydroxylase (fatty acid hydroxylase superfamily)